MQITYTNRADENISTQIYENKDDKCEVVVQVAEYEVGVIVNGKSLEIVTDKKEEAEPVENEK